MQQWLRVRNAIFAEDGFCMDAPQLKGDASIYFVKLANNGRAEKIDCIQEGKSADMLHVTLTPYPNAEKALGALTVMMAAAPGVDAYDARCTDAFAAAWNSMVNDGLMLSSCDPASQLKLVSHVYGAGRINDELNTKGTLQYFAAKAPPWPDLVREALPRASSSRLEVA